MNFRRNNKGGPASGANRGTRLRQPMIEPFRPRALIAGAEYGRPVRDDHENVLAPALPRA